MTTLQKAVPVAAALAVVLVLAGLFAWRRPSPQVAPHPQSFQSVPAPAPQSAVPAPVTQAGCQAPGAPPQPPDGAKSTAADMKRGHDSIQAFVVQLEAYQSCLNAQIDNAGPDVPATRKQAWLDQGNGAVDEANLLAKAFSFQIKTFHDTHPGQ